MKWVGLWRPSLDSSLQVLPGVKGLNGPRLRPPPFCVKSAGAPEAGGRRGLQYRKAALATEPQGSWEAWCNSAFFSSLSLLSGQDSTPHCLWGLIHTGRARATQANGTNWCEWEYPRFTQATSKEKCSNLRTRRVPPRVLCGLGPNQVLRKNYIYHLRLQRWETPLFSWGVLARHGPDCCTFFKVKHNQIFSKFSPSIPFCWSQPENSQMYKWRLLLYHQKADSKTSKTSTENSNWAGATACRSVSPSWSKGQRKVSKSSTFVLSGRNAHNGLLGKIFSYTNKLENAQPYQHPWSRQTASFVQK